MQYYRIARVRSDLYCYHDGVTGFANKTPIRDLSTIFLDRDGVLNKKMPEGSYVASLADFRLLPDVPEAIGLLNRAGFRVVVASNQRGIALGLYTVADVEAIHAALQGSLKAQSAHVDAFYFCPHDKGQCKCRKPLAGLFEQAAADFPSISAATSAMIGDSLSDIEFGHRLGMLTVLIDSGQAHCQPGAEAAAELADLRFPSLTEAVNTLLASRPSTDRSD